MTDFVDDLERELLAAARRRGRRRVPRIAVRPIVAFVAVAAVVLAAVVLISRPAPDDRSVTHPPATGPTFKVPPAIQAKPCGAGQPPTGEPAPAAVAKDIQLLRRAPTKADILPSLVQGGEPQPYGTWLPVGKLAVTSARTPAGTQGLHVMSTSDVRTAPLACAPTESRGPGACLIAGDPGQPLQLRCFTLAEIREGRAFMLASATEGGAQLVGLVPDGTAQVALQVGEAHALLAVHENVVQEYVQGLTAADDVTIGLDPPAAGGIVLVVNRTRIQGLAAAIRDELRAKLKLDAQVDTGTPPRRTTVVIARDAQAEPLARRVAGALGVPVERAKSPIAADVVVLAGSDRMR